MLDEQMGFLEHSMERYDDGHVAEAKRLAVTIRVLCHDTRHSTSLLRQLGWRRRMVFTSAAQFRGGNMLPNCSLVVMRQTRTEDDLEMAWEPLCAVPEGGPFEPIPVGDLDAWWGEVVARDEHGAVWKRSGFVLSLANEDGGAHIAIPACPPATSGCRGRTLLAGRSCTGVS